MNLAERQVIAVIALTLVEGALDATMARSQTPNDISRESTTVRTRPIAEAVTTAAAASPGARNTDRSTHVASALAERNGETNGVASDTAEPDAAQLSVVALRSRLFGRGNPAPGQLVAAHPSLPPHRRGGGGSLISTYCVRDDGTVTSPLILESTGSAEMAASLLTSLGSWHISPASVDGAPSESCVTFGWISGSSRGLLNGARDAKDLLAKEAGLFTMLIGSQLIGTPGVVTPPCPASYCKPYWNTSLLRSEFGFTKLAGQFDHFELRCKRRFYVSPVNTTSAWKVPAAWGPCELYVFGDDGASLALIEYPSPLAPGRTLR